MKKLVFLFLAVGFIACKNNDTKKIVEDPLLKVNLDSVPKTSVLVLDSLIDFGTVKEGEKVNREFRLVNIGKNPLIIQYANASCGCTVAEKPKEPILPGDTGIVKASFDSKDRVGIADKRITIISNADTLIKPLILRGKVEKSN
jgi:hypothetical protein